MLLRDELGTSPGPAAMAVHQRLLRGEPAPRPRPTPPAARAWPVPLAAAIERHALVGRATELAFLERCLAQAQRGSRQLVLLAGDAGIGKTRAAAELARRAHDGGAVVLYGRFDEQTAAPYQPVVEMIRGWSGGASLDAAARAARRARRRAGDPAAGAGRRRPPPLPAGGAEADARRLRFFDAVAALLGEVGRRRARGAACSTTCTGPTGRRSSSCATSSARPQPQRALFLGTYREAELPAEHPLHELVGDLRREGTLKRLELGGPGRGGGRRAGRRARRPHAGARLHRGAARRDGGQPVLHRGGRRPPARRGRPARRGGHARRGGRARGRARGDLAPAAAARRRRAPGASPWPR